MAESVPEFQEVPAAAIETSGDLGSVEISARPWTRNPLPIALWTGGVQLLTIPLEHNILLMCAAIAASFVPLILIIRVRRDRLVLSPTSVIRETFYGPWRRTRTVTQVGDVTRAEVVGWWAWSRVRLTLRDGTHLDQYVGNTDDHIVLAKWLNGQIARARFDDGARLPVEAIDAVPEELRALGFRARQSE